MKLFKNGSIQMTGCTTLLDSLDAIYICMTALNTIRGVIVNGKIIDKKFCSEKIKASEITDYKICLINSGFSIPFWINRGKLLDIMLKNNVNAFYDRNIHSGVIIKHTVDNSKITILVFEQGSIVITGAKTSQHMKESYKFINIYLLKNYVEIHKTKELDFF